MYTFCNRFRAACNACLMMTVRFFQRGVATVCWMSYGDPSSRDALECLRQEGCQRLAVIPLYPQSAHSTTGSALRKVRSCLKEMGWSPDAREVESYPTGSYQAYVDAIASSIAAAGFSVAKDRVAFSFHSIPRDGRWRQRCCLLRLNRRKRCAIAGDSSRTLVAFLSIAL